jgi:Spy/CpxP family protein refolding chaperone
MRMTNRSTWKAVGMAALLTAIPASGWTFGGPYGAGRMGPPQESIDACAGKKAGDTVAFKTPRGDEVSAMCRETPAGLAALPGRGPGSGRMERGPGRHFARMAKTLDLTAAQKEKIRAVLEGEREKAAPLRQQLADNRDKLRQVVETLPYDEAAVRKVAASQEKIRVEVIVSRTRAMNEVFALLTPEQQAKAKELRPFREGRPGRGPGMW